MTTTGGENSFKNDYKFIVRYIKDIVEKYDLKIDTIAYDPHNADGVLADLEEFGCPLLMVAQSARNLNDATKDIINLYKSKLLEYNKNNALFVWSFSHAKIVANSFGEIKVDKEGRKKIKRIDPVDACIDSHFAFMKRKEEPIDVQEELGKYLDEMGW